MSRHPSGWSSTLVELLHETMKPESRAAKDDGRQVLELDLENGDHLQKQQKIAMN